MEPMLEITLKREFRPKHFPSMIEPLHGSKFSASMQRRRTYRKGDYHGNGTEPPVLREDRGNDASRCGADGHGPGRLQLERRRLRERTSRRRRLRLGRGNRRARRGRGPGRRGRGRHRGQGEPRCLVPAHREGHKPPRQRQQPVFQRLVHVHERRPRASGPRLSEGAAPQRHGHARRRARRLRDRTDPQSRLDQGARRRRHRPDHRPRHHRLRLLPRIPRAGAFRGHRLRRIHRRGQQVGPRHQVHERGGGRPAFRHAEDRVPARGPGEIRPPKRCSAASTTTARTTCA